MCDAQEPWKQDQIAEYRLNFSFIWCNETETLSGACWNQKISKPFLSIITKVNVKIV